MRANNTTLHNDRAHQVLDSYTSSSSSDIGGFQPLLAIHVNLQRNDAQLSGPSVLCSLPKHELSFHARGSFRYRANTRSTIYVRADSNPPRTDTGIGAVQSDLAVCSARRHAQVAPTSICQDNRTTTSCSTVGVRSIHHVHLHARQPLWGASQHEHWILGPGIYSHHLPQLSNATGQH